jgi:hypothetical protein
MVIKMNQYLIYSMHIYPYSHYKGKTLKQKINSDFTTTTIINPNNKEKAIELFSSSEKDRKILKIIRVWHYPITKSKLKFIG